MPVALLRSLPRIRARPPTTLRPFSTTPIRKDLEIKRGPLWSVVIEEENVRQNEPPSTSLRNTWRLPEFNLANHVILVSGGARGLGLTQAEALLEAGATGESSCDQCNNFEC
jgi:hypothetical protein